MAQLELSLLVGKESKQWLADVTALVDRLEKLTGKVAKSIDDDADEETTATDDTDDDEDFAPKKKAGVKTKGFDDEDETEDADEEEPVAKKKAKKISLDDVNDACKARALETGGKEGRQEVLNILKKKFKVKSVTELEPEQYASVIAAMKS